MILQALCDYYDRKARDPDEALAPPGFEWREIPFVVLLQPDGTFLDIKDTWEGTGRNRRAKSFLVPQGSKRSGSRAYETAFLLWDNPLYVLGLSPDPQKMKKAALYQASFRASVDRFLEETGGDPGVKAVQVFLSGNEWKRAAERFRSITDAKGTENCTFGLAGPDSDSLILDRPSVVSAASRMAAQGGVAGHEMCLVTGTKGAVARLHPAIRGVRGAQTTGANIVSFNLDAFTSYGKDQGSNAPVGQQAAFAYTTALNHLLGKDSRQKMLVGDATVVFWAENPVPMESLMEDLFGEPPKDDPDRLIQAVRALYEAPRAGAPPLGDGETRFFVLGLAPNASRLSVRFWVVTTVGKLAVNIRRHFDDLRIVHGPKEPDVLPLFRLLVNLASQGKADNIPPNLAGEVMCSVLSGTAYPRALLSAAVGRSRAEQSNDHGPVPYARAAILKACLTREIRAGRVEGKEITVGLDLTNENVGYRLGRLFAVLEKAQEEASPGINATIRDRYYGAASSTPASVFPTLMRLKNHHIAKLENRGRAVNLERLISEVVGEVQDFPPILNLPDQGRFALGYYHQRQTFYEKNTDTPKEVK
jgi:CRISPR-associated protein Csd1